MWEFKFASMHTPTMVESLCISKDLNCLGHPLFHPTLSQLANITGGTDIRVVLDNVILKRSANLLYEFIKTGKNSFPLILGDLLRIVTGIYEVDGRYLFPDLNQIHYSIYFSAEGKESRIERLDSSVWHPVASPGESQIHIMVELDRNYDEWTLTFPFGP